MDKLNHQMYATTKACRKCSADIIDKNISRTVRKSQCKKMNICKAISVIYVKLNRQMSATTKAGRKLSAVQFRQYSYV